MKSRVVIAGGGVAALETALALRELAGDRVEVDIFSPRKDFVYRPYAVGEPYGAAQARRYDLERLAPLCGARFHLDSITAVDHETRLVATHDGEHHSYDYLVVACGTRAIWPVPGAITFWGVAEDADVRRLMTRIESGEVKSVAFALPGSESWALPVYELALLAERQLAAAGVDDVSLTVVTPEELPLGVFGRRAATQVAALLRERGIGVLTATRPVRFAGGRLTIVPGDSLEVDAVVSVPQLEGRRIRGVLHDVNGHVVVDEHCRILRRERMYAAGDVTNFPVKQGGIATQQADVVAESIAAEVGVEIEPRSFDPILRGVLWTGEAPKYLQGWLEGGHGEDDCGLFDIAPWSEGEGKIVGRHLTRFLNEVDSGAVAATALG